MTGVDLKVRVEEWFRMRTPSYPCTCSRPPYNDKYDWCGLKSESERVGQNAYD